MKHRIDHIDAEKADLVERPPTPTQVVARGRLPHHASLTCGHDNLTDIAGSLGNELILLHLSVANSGTSRAPLRDIAEPLRETAACSFHRNKPWTCQLQPLTDMIATGKMICSPESARLMAEMRADLAAFGPDDEIVLLVEVKKAPMPTNRWAGEVMQLIKGQAKLPKMHYFMLVTPECSFLWKAGKTGRLRKSPDFQSNSTHWFSSYLDEIGSSSREVSGSSFELIVYLWLTDLSRGSGAVENESPILIASGLANELKGCRIEREVVL